MEKTSIRKLVSIDEASQIREGAKGRKVVTINGSYDLVHPGHIFSFEEAKRQGDILIVGLNSDRSVKAYKHGQGPIIDEKGRAFLLSAIECIDYIVLFDEPDPVEFLDRIKPDIHCNAASYGEDCVEAEVVKRNGGKLHLIPDDIGGDMRYSTSNIAEEIAKRHKPRHKFVIFDKDGILHIDAGYTHRIEDFRIPDKTIEGIKRFRDAGYKFIVITNQSGIAQGKYDEEAYEIFIHHMRQKYGKHGIFFEEVYHCPHHPDFTGPCDCRKPAAGMFRKAIKEHNIDTGRSIAIGDSDRDIMAAKKAGIRTTGFINTAKDTDNCHADYAAKDMDELSGMILGSD